MEHLEAKNLKSLKYLYCGLYTRIDDATFLSGLEHLKEVHLHDNDGVLEIFGQKQQCGRTDLKIFLGGFLLGGPDDPAIDFFDDFEEFFVHLAKNPSRLADEIPLWKCLPYSAPEGVAPESMVNILSRFSDLNEIEIKSSIPAQDVQRFLDLLKHFPNIVYLEFSVDQPQDLFDRLPEHSAVRCLTIDCPVSDFRFLFRLEHLLILHGHDQINAEIIQKAFEELPFFSVLKFKHLNQKVEIVKYFTFPWTVWIGEERTVVSGLNAAIQFVFGQTA